MTKKNAAKEEKEEKPVKSVEELILNCEKNKYSAIPLAALWANELRRKEENRHLTQVELLDLAISDVLTGVVDWKDLKKAAKTAGKAAADGVGSNGKTKKSK